jgi:hypothetical protein
MSNILTHAKNKNENSYQFGCFNMTKKLLNGNVFQE